MTSGYSERPFFKSGSTRGTPLTCGVSVAGCGLWPSAETHRRTTPGNRSPLRAAAADLSQMHGFLTAVDHHREEFGMDTPDTRLSLLARELAVEVASLVQRLAEAVGPPPSTQIDGP